MSASGDAKRAEARRVKALLLEAADLERQAATMTHSIAALDEQRSRVLIAAYMKRREAQEVGR
jgi:hypothetical protein